MRILNFNILASAAIAASTGTKLRIQNRDGVMFIRPTDRKASPHLAGLNGTASPGFSIEIPDAQLEKVAGTEVLADASTFGLTAAKYGWYALTAAGSEGSVDGAEVSVSSKDETVTAEVVTDEA